TTWAKANPDYESAMEHFVTEALRNAPFIQDLERFANEGVKAGRINSLSQTLRKPTAPGLPDIYQGCELCEFSLVDPDNRRPVDFGLRQRLLAEAKDLSAAEVLKRGDDGLSKAWLIQKALKLRAEKSEFFENGYEPLFARGDKAKHVIAFVRGGGAI